MMISFFVIESKREHAMLDLSLFKVRSFGGASIVAWGLSATMFALRFCSHWIESNLKLYPVAILFTCAVFAIVGLLAGGAGLSMACAAIAVAVALWTDDRLRGVGVALAVWLAMTVLYDGLVLALSVSLDSWPLERPLVGLMLMNPVDVARGLVITQLDVPALMGLTGALFERAFGSALGSMVAVTALCAWVAVPFTVAGRRFQRRDF